MTSLRIDPSLVRNAQTALKGNTKTEAIERALETVIDMAAHREIVRKYSGKGKCFFSAVSSTTHIVTASVRTCELASYIKTYIMFSEHEVADIRRSELG